MANPTLVIDLNQFPGDVSSPLNSHVSIPPPPPPPPPLPQSPFSQTLSFDLNQFPTDVYSPVNSHLDQFIENVSPPINSHLTVPPPQSLEPNKKKNLTIEQKRGITEMLFRECNDSKLPKGAITRAATHFSISNRSVSRIWREVKSCLNNDDVVDFSSQMVRRVGRKRVEVNLETMQSIPLRRRRNIRSLAKALRLGKSTVHRRIKEKSILPHSNPVKPYLSNDNKEARLEFCLSMIDEGTHEAQSSFINMYDRIHIDEKWFYMSKTSQKYYLHSDEIEPYRTCKSKRFITKIMFLAAVARPRFDSTTNEEFDGKIGIWPFVFKEPAKRNSKNRQAGTLETKPIASITKDVIRSCLIEKLLPAIKEKWPTSGTSPIFIQQDNARPHISASDVEFVEAANRYGLNICLCYQPPNSPDLNVLDLGFFRAIDSLQHQEAPKTIDEFVLAVEKAFQIFPKEDLNNVFLTLQSCMIEIMRALGGNNYKIPHMNKKRLARIEQLPICIEVDSHVLNAAKQARGAV